MRTPYSLVFSMKTSPEYLSPHYARCQGFFKIDLVIEKYGTIYIKGKP